MSRRKTGIIGGGASGMMAALAAAGKNGTGDEVFILEKKERIGKKILATGNGRCNLTNLSFCMDRLEEYYRGAPAGRLRSLFSRFSPEDACRLFEKMGMLTVSRDGYVYPFSGQASTPDAWFCLTGLTMDQPGFSGYLAQQRPKVEKYRRGLAPGPEADAVDALIRKIQQMV